MPVVPRIEIPPRMPNLGLRVSRARISPPGTLMVTFSPRPPSRSPASSRTLRTIIRRGTGLIAGSPTGTGRPGSVTCPTPSPPARMIPGSACQATVACNSAPSVTSGSSPASLITPQRTPSAVRSQRATAKFTSSRTGRSIVISVTACPVSSARVAARAAAVAQLPVVKPSRKSVRRQRASEWFLGARLPIRSLIGSPRSGCRGQR